MYDLKLMFLVWISLIDPAIIIALKVAAGTIFGDAIIGWILAFVKGQFNIRLAVNFIKTSIIPYMGVLLALVGLTVVNPDYKPVFYLICTLVAAKFGVEALKDKLVQFFKPTSDPPVS